MRTEDIQQAARLLAAAHRDGTRVNALPPTARPTSFAEAAAIQDSMLGLLGERAAGYKVAGTTPEGVMWGAILASRLKPAPAAFPAALVPMLGVEPEIAFRLEADVAGSAAGLTLDGLDRLVSVVPAIEIVDSRFASYEGTPLLHRAADLMSNGGLVHGETWTGVSSTALRELSVAMHAGGATLAAVTGGHPAGDPRLPALAFLQAPGRPAVLPRGTIITTGSYAGLLRARPGDAVTATFAGYGSVALSLTACILDAIA
jgi:2-keto-4-pentenoate hydratase